MMRVMADVTAPVIELTLESFPVALFTAADEQWAGMLREYELRGFGTAQQTYGAADTAAAARALRAVNAALAAHARASGVPALPDRVRLRLAVSGHGPGDFATLQAVLEDARRLAVSGQLLACRPCRRSRRCGTGCASRWRPARRGGAIRVGVRVGTARLGVA
jgi:hypothetical protein